MKIIVCGRRSFINYKFLADKLDELTFKLRTVEVVTGGNKKGVDRMAQDWSYRNGYTYYNYHPDYKKYPGKVAPLKRNEEMAKHSGAMVCIAFWDGEESGGTWDMIEQAHKYGLQVKIVRID